MTTCRLIVDFQSDKKLLQSLLNMNQPKAQSNAEPVPEEEEHAKSEWIHNPFI